ncbi:ribosome small subunit-dependent GTPase A [Malacoplasma muris]|uniref:ribosome small subunit-dependent GTPase A n=1 Tax=Malacoplasma muris TaxID=2119 RepID=UPI00398F1FE7
MNGKVIKKSASFFNVICNNLNYICFSRKKVKNDASILVGDNVEFIKEDSTYIIEKILPRKNKLIRPSVANIDIIIIVISVVEPKLNTFQLNKYLAYYEYQNIDNVIIYFSKMDLLKEKDEILNKINEYKKDGYKCLFSDKTESIDTINTLFDKNNVICLAGESGVGKSTLINKLIPDSNITTNIISKSLNRGKHTTTTSNLISYKNGFIVDTPGFGSIELNIPNDEIAKSYNDFRSYGKYCKFRNCLHKNENGCKVKEMVEKNKISKERYNDYLKIINSNKYKVKY